MSMETNFLKEKCHFTLLIYCSIYDCKFKVEAWNSWLDNIILLITSTLLYCGRICFGKWIARVEAAVFEFTL